MNDKPNNASDAPTGTIAVDKAGSFSTLERFISSNGPMNWRDCLAQFHDVCFNMEKNRGPQPEIGDISIHSLVVRNLDSTTGGISIEFSADAAKASDTNAPVEAYMSPERCLDRAVNRRSDVYSLGCVMYHCLTGAPPFMNRDVEKLKEMQAIDYALPPGRRSQLRVIPDEVDVLIANCLEKDPARRYKNASVLRADIGRVLQLEEWSDEPPNHGKKFSEFLKERRKIFVAVSALVALTAAFACVSLNTATSKEFNRMIKRTVDRKRNKYFLALEHGPQYLAQAEFGNGTMEADRDKDPIEIKVRDKDLIIFATTKRANIKEALEEAVRRKLILHKADLVGQDLSGATMAGGNMPNAFLAECNLDGANFKGAQLMDAVFVGSSLKGANLAEISGQKAIFQGCNLEGAKITGALLFDCDFSHSNLKNVDFSGSQFLNSNFEGADLTGANFNGCSLSRYGAETANLSPKQRADLKLVGVPLKPKKAEPSVEAFDQNNKLNADKVRTINPFSKPVEGTNAFGPSQVQQEVDEPIGLKIDLNNLPPEPPRKSNAPAPPPLQRAIPGQKIVVPKANSTVNPQGK